VTPPALANPHFRARIESERVVLHAS
jgi:hypothetical protein